MSLVYLMGLVLMSACGSDHGDAGVPYPIPTDFEVAVVADSVAQAYCDAFRRCQPDIRTSFLLFRDACVREISGTLYSSLSRLEPGVSTGRIKYSPDGLRTCLQGISASTCHQVDIEAFEIYCTEPLRGTVRVGESCTLDSECDGGFCPGEDGCMSACVRLSKQGESCATDGERQCEAGLDCDSSQRCVVKAELAFRAEGGQRCDVVRCRRGFHCLAAPDRRCHRNEDRFAFVAGNSCPALESSPTVPTCGPELICQYEDAAALENGGVCRPVPKVGEACLAGRPQPHLWCEPGAHCSGIDPNMGRYRGECRHIPTAGEPCGDHYGRPFFCEHDATCNDGICVRKPSVGEACEGFGDCLEGRCQTGACRLLCVDIDSP